MRTYTHLECLEHVAEGLYPDEEVADNHRRTEVGSVVERLLAHALEVHISGTRCLFACRGERTHRSSETEQHDM